MENTLATWLNMKLQSRGWSQRELARRAGVSHTTVSQVISKVRQPTWDFCASVAVALGEPIDEVFILAGLKNPLPPAVEEEREAIRILRSLSTTVRNVAMTVLRAIAGESTNADISTGLAESVVPYDVLDDAYIHELLEEYQKVPDEWKAMVIQEVTRVRQFSELPATRFVGENEEERNAAES